MFNEKVRIVQIDIARFGDRRRNFFHTDWEEYPIHDSCGRFVGRLDPPTRLDDLVRIAEALARGTDFVRIDCHQVGGRIFLGEMTHAPGSGLSPLFPAVWDDRWCDMWEITTARHRDAPAAPPGSYFAIIRPRLSVDGRLLHGACRLPAGRE